MSKNEVMFDMRFKDVCDMYGFDCENFDIIANAIVIFTPNRYGCVVLDENYNIVYLGENCFDKEYECDRKITPDYIISMLICDYSINCDKMLSINFKKLIELSNRIEIIDGKLFINGDLVDSNSNKDSMDLLYTSKFFAQEINKYNLNNYHMLCIGVSIPDMLEYSKIMMNEIISYLTSCIEDNSVPCTKSLLSKLGLSNLDNDVDILSLEATIRVLLRRCGYDIQNNFLVNINEEYSFGDLSVLHKKFVDEEYNGYGIVKIDGKTESIKPKLIMK